MDSKTIIKTREEILKASKFLKLYEANEAETRLKIINKVLVDILGWADEEISVEERVSEDGKITFADYILRTAMTSIIVEAKKIGSTFNTVFNTPTIKLRGKVLQGETGQAIKQARDYARKKSIPFAVVTNGCQWIIFPATRIDQVTFANSNALVFSSLEEILDGRFEDFFHLLGRDSVIDGNLNFELLGRFENQIENRRLKDKFDRPFYKFKRIHLYDLIEEGINSALSEDIINKNDDLLKKCYVETPDRRRFDKKIGFHIRKRNSPIKKTVSRPQKKRDKEVLRKIIKKAQEAFRPLAILIIGTVGAGKSTFLTYTRRIQLAEVFEPKKDKPYPHWIYLDFRTFADEEKPLRFIAKEIKTYIQEDDFLSDHERCIKHAYKDDIKALEKGPLAPISEDKEKVNDKIASYIFEEYKKTIPYIEKILNYATSNVPVFLIIDNVDQIQSEEVQNKIFLDAMALAHRVNLNLFFALRETTFIKQRASPVFDAFDFEYLKIDSPNVEQVLRKRFFVAHQIVKGQKAEFIAENGATIKLDDKSVIIDLIQHSILGTNVGKLIDVLATSDIRLALRMTRGFLQSGYSLTGKALDIFQKTGRYTLPPHEALKAIMLGGQDFYAEEYSVLGNPFDSRAFLNEAQLLRLLILTTLANYGRNKNFEGLEGIEIRNKLRSLGFSDDIILKVLHDLCFHRFIFTTSHSPASFEASYIASRLGAYVVRDLISNFAFLENIMNDTFISDENVWDQLVEITQKIYKEKQTVKKLELRIKRVKGFYKFLKNEYEKTLNHCIERKFPSEWILNPFKENSSDLNRNTQKALASAKKHYGKP